MLYLSSFKEKLPHTLSFLVHWFVMLSLSRTLSLSFLSLVSLARISSTEGMYAVPLLLLSLSLLRHSPRDGDVTVMLDLSLPGCEI